MLINPVERYFRNQEKLEIAHNLLCDGVSIEKIVKATGLSEEEILDDNKK